MLGPLNAHPKLQPEGMFEGVSNAAAPASLTIAHRSRPESVAVETFLRCQHNHRHHHHHHHNHQQQQQQPTTTNNRPKGLTSAHNHVARQLSEFTTASTTHKDTSSTAYHKTSTTSNRRLRIPSSSLPHYPCAGLADCKLKISSSDEEI